jgi:molybdenum cofactor cytidylyltransferase
MALPPAGVVLAAGASNRLGQPKALIRVGGTSLLARAVNQLTALGCSPVYVVTRTALMVDVLLEADGATVLVNSNPDEGRTGSLQVALKALYAERGRWPSHVVMAPVDRPGWRPDAVAPLLAQSGCRAPAFDGRRGHPVTLDGEAMSAVLGASPAVPLRDVVAFEASPVHGPWLGLNIDTPEALSHLLENEAALTAYWAEGEGI